MPLREYTCPKCGETIERLVKSSDENDQHCEHHPKIKLERVDRLTPILIKFKGAFH